MVFYEHCEQYGENLLLATRQLVWHKRLAHLREAYLIVCAYYFLTGVGEERVNDVLEPLLWLRQFLRLFARRGPAFLQHLYNAVADVDLIVEILALELVELPVEFRGKRDIHLRHHLGIDKRAVKRPDDVVAYPVGILWTDLQVHAFKQVGMKLATGSKPFHHLVDYGRLAHAVDTA